MLKELGLNFEIAAIEHDELLQDDMHVDEVAEHLAVEKSHSMEDPKENELIITADTIVVLNGEILHKPKDEKEAIEMLGKLSGDSHRVDTGVCLRSKHKEISFTESTIVTFRTLEDQEIKQYVEQFKPLDKAGAYGIQEWIGYIGVERIEGCYYNVMGLPLSRLYSALKSF